MSEHAPESPLARELGPMTAGVVPAVSVCVPVYCGETFLHATIESVLAQTFTDFELVVLDNASPDRSGAIAASFGDSRVVIHRNSTTLPVGENWNRAVSLCRAPLVKLMCADDLMHPRCLEQQVSIMDGDPRLALVASRQHLISVPGRIIVRSRFLRGLLGVRNHRDLVRRAVRHGGNPVGAPVGVMFRRTAFDQTRGFGSDVFVNDLDLVLQLSRYGLFLGMRDPLASFRIVPGALSGNAGRAEYDLQRQYTRAIARDAAVLRRDRALGTLTAPLARTRRRALFATQSLLHPRVKERVVVRS